MTFGLLVALALGSSPAVTNSLGFQSSDGGAGPVFASSFEYEVDVRGLGERVNETGQLELRLGANLVVTLQLILDESASRPTMVKYHYANGSSRLEEQPKSYTFQGRVIDAPGTDAHLTISQFGIAGYVKCNGYRYDIDRVVRPGESVDPAAARETVSRWADRDWRGPCLPKL